MKMNKPIVFSFTIVMLVTVGLFALPVSASTISSQESMASGNAWVIYDLGEMRGRACLNIDLWNATTPDESGTYGTVKFGFGTLEQIEPEEPPYGEYWWWGWNITQIDTSKGRTVLVCVPSDFEGSDIMFGSAPVPILIRIGAYEEGARITANGYNFRFTGEIIVFGD